MALFRKLKARRAKHGFEAYLRIEHFQELANAKAEIEKLDPQALVMLNTDMSNKQFLVYTNDDKAAEVFEAQFC